ncbi:hypothetical protein MRX96_057928 [Rhipicephalus microplus]
MPSSIAPMSNAACMSAVGPAAQPSSTTPQHGQQHQPHVQGRLDGFQTAINLLMRRRFSTGQETGARKRLALFHLRQRSCDNGWASTSAASSPDDYHMAPIYEKPKSATLPPMHHHAHRAGRIVTGSTAFFILKQHSNTRTKKDAPGWKKYSSSSD